MIEKIKPHPCIDANGVVYGEIQPDNQEMTEKINELVDAVNGILDYAPLEMAMKAEPDQYKSITYMSDGHIKKFYGHDSIVELEVPLPQGTRITIKSITKGGDNE